MQDIRETLYILLHASKEELEDLLQQIAHAPETAEAKWNELRRKYVPPATDKSRGPRTAEEVRAALLSWVDEPRPPALPLSNEALRRENLYD